MRSRKHRPHLQVLGLRCVKEKVLNTRRSRGRAVSSGEARFYLQYTVLDEGREVNRSVRSRGRKTLASCGAQFQPGDGPWCLPRLIVRPLEQHGAMLGWPLPGAPWRGSPWAPIFTLLLVLCSLEGQCYSLNSGTLLPGCVRATKGGCHHVLKSCR